MKKRTFIYAFLSFFCILPAFSQTPEVTPIQESDLATVHTTVIDSAKGNFKKDNPKIPQFYIWRRIYQKKGESRFKLYLVSSKGVLSLVDNMGDFYDDWYGRKIAARRETEDDPLVSASGKWQILRKDEEDRRMRFVLKNVVSNSVAYINLPGFDGTPSDMDWFVFSGWSPSKDLFYLWTSGGADTGRNNAYLQFDPKSKKFISLGSGVSLDCSEDGEWVVWVDGDGMSYVDRQINVYCIETNKNYILTKGHSDNAFVGWLGDEVVAQWKDAEAHIQAGRAHFFKKEFEQAIQEYQKATTIAPDSSVAYGLMGYSYYRMKKMDMAQQALEKASGFGFEHGMTYYNLALVLWAKGDADRATSFLDDICISNNYYFWKIKKDPQFNELLKSPAGQRFIKKWNR